jgi:signal transduction histidine kinase
MTPSCCPPDVGVSSADALGEDRVGAVFPAPRRALGVAVMIAIALLQLAAEYLASGDYHRLLAKVVALAVGLPLVIGVGFALFRWMVSRHTTVWTVLFAGAVASGLLFALLLSLVRLAGFSIDALHPRTLEWSEVNVLRIGFTMGLTSYALWALAFVFPFAAEDARLRALESEKLRSEAELAQLRAHLEPHFLLNTLNAVAGLVTEDPREARRLLAALGDLLRDSLEAEGEMQTLDEQVAWLRRYAHILEIRHAGHLHFRWDLQAETCRAELPRLLLQPLVENAVKHGALMRRGGGEVTVRVKVDGGKLVCTVEDNGPGIRDGPTRAGAFGVASVRRRLALRYADAASLRLESSPTGTRSIVEVPCHE